MPFALSYACERHDWALKPACLIQRPHSRLLGHASHSSQGLSLGPSQIERRVEHGKQVCAAVSGAWGQISEHLQGLPSVEAGSPGLAAHERRPHSLPLSR